jgi:hypothetical protein
MWEISKLASSARLLPLIPLPNTCPQNRAHFPHVKLLCGVSPDTWSGFGFKGKIYQAGRRVSAEELGENPVALESAGPQGTHKHGKKRAYLWILWRYDWQEKAWKEIARTCALGPEWVTVLREPAIEALRPEAALQANSIDRGREVSDGLLQTIDDALVMELPAVRAMALASLYDQVAGRLAAA